MTSAHRSDMGYKYFGLDEGPMRDAEYFDKETQEYKKVLDWWASNFPTVRLQRLDLPMVCISSKGKPGQVVSGGSSNPL